ncbi:PREDICTED: proteinase-activated receptor 1-like, partial [Cariama cristata]|uniref:proteinase-activated receptor 1-like n=1 Tax=Cariama cristata TaxID=54380 RepID=UPI000520135E
MTLYQLKVILKMTWMLDREPPIRLDRSYVNNEQSILVFLKKMKIEKPAVVYMLNLALADVLFVSVLPFKIAYHFSGNDWAFGPQMCRFITAAFYCNILEYLYFAYLLCVCISSVSCCIDPFIYYYASSQYKE